MTDLTFVPKNEEDLQTLLTVGIGSFEVSKAIAKPDKNGKPMIKLILKVWDESGQEGIIFDYLMLNEHKFSLRKIRHFCYAIGIGNLYEDGKLNASDCEGKFGKLQIGIQKDKEGNYPDKNNVRDYIYLQKSPNNDIPSDLNDDIPWS